MFNSPKMIKTIKFFVAAATVFGVCFFIFKTYQGQTGKNQGNNSKQQEEKDNFLALGNLSPGKIEDPLEYTGVDNLKEKSNFQEEIYASNTNKPVITNQWFSSVYFSDVSEALFAYPLVVKFTKEGFQVGYPNIHKTPDAIFGSFSGDVKVDLNEKVSAFVFASSDLSVQVLLKSDTTNRDIATVTITRGSPYVFVDIVEKNQAITIETIDVIQDQGNDTYSSKAPMQATYGLFFDESKFEIAHEEGDYRKLDIKAAANKTLFSVGIAAKDMQLESLKQYALDPIDDTQVNFSIIEGEYVNTMSYVTRDSKKTLLALFSWQNQFDKMTQFSESLNTIRGQQEIYIGNKTQFSLSRTVPKEQLEVGKFSSQDRDALKKMINKDVTQFKGFAGNDTYFLGKEIFRAAQLYDLAMQLNLVDESKILHDALRAELERWKIQSMDINNEYANHYLAYDPQIKGIVGYSPSFGSEEFNDHHFHYGYFIHAAAILGRYDTTYVQQNKEFMNLFVKDFVNYDKTDENFAFLRNFDLYERHSWAAGRTPFSDGNNQESSSEAVHAYYGAYAWSRVIENKELEEVSLWLYNSEIDSAKRYWFIADSQDSLYDSYQHSVISLLWAGKIEWATWFSAEAEAKLGIQLLPMYAGSDYLFFSPKEIDSYLAETAFPQKKLFFDYLVMFSAPNNPIRAKELLQDMSDDEFDGGNSRSFTYAWISQIQASDKN